MSLPVAILAGGLATRLRPLTETLPKSLIQVAGKPFLYHQLRALCAQGVKRVVLCVGYLGNVIQDAIGDGSGFGLDVSYAFDGDELLGTGGALRRALPLLGDAFFVLYGDSFLPIDFIPVEHAFLQSQKQALMTVFNNCDGRHQNNVLFQEGELIEYNKQAPRQEMHYIDYGLGVLSREALLMYPVGQPFDLADVYYALSLRGQLAGFEVSTRFYEIGSHVGLKETEVYLRTHVK